MKRILLTLFITLMTVSIWASEFTQGGVRYREIVYNETTALEVIQLGSDNYSGKVIIPEQVNGYLVVSIGDNAFSDCYTLTSITIPNSVRRIGEHAFFGCWGLTSVIIPNSVTFIGLAAFEQCWGLSSVTISNSVEQISPSMFSHCSQLKSVTIPNSVRDILDRAFEECTSLESVIIPNSVWEIYSSAFQGCSSLTSVEIPNSVTRIEMSVFEGCTSLESVIIPNSVTAIWPSAFSDCTGLTSVEIPNSVNSIGSNAFARCSGLTSVDIPNSVTGIGSDAFLNVPSITYSGTATGYPWGAESMNEKYLTYTDVTKTTIKGCSKEAKGIIIIPKSVTTIAGSAFQNCSSITSVTIPNSVTSIGEYAFYGCSALNTTNIPNLVTSVANGAFRDCTSLSSVEMPNSITSIGDYAFQNCSSLNSITIPNSVRSIGVRAFQNCSALTSITIPENITSFGNSAFSGCSSLTSVVWNATNCPSFTADMMDYIVRNQITSLVIGENVTSIPKELCSNMKKITSVTIPYGVTSIGDKAFYYCTSLTSLSIPSTVSNIGSLAFYDCSKIFSISVPFSVITIGTDAFYDIPHVQYTGSATGSPWGAKVVNGYMDGYLLYSDNTKTKIVACSPYVTGAIDIPSTVTTVASTAFDGCTGLTAVHISDLEKWCRINFIYKEANPLTYAHRLYLNEQEVVDLTIPSTITTIYYNAFYGCNSLQTVTIPNSVTRIYGNAFSGCKNLTTVTMPNTVTQIGDSSFQGCSSLVSINIPNSVTQIGSSAFYGCSALTSIDIPNSVTSIGNYAFTFVRNLKYSGSAADSWESDWGALTRNGYIDGYLVYTDNSQTTLSGCSTAATGDIIISGTVTNIKTGAFDGCKNPISVTIPNSMTRIIYDTFKGCSGLFSVTIPNSVTIIGANTFKDCSELTSVTCIAKEVPLIYGNAFPSAEPTIHVLSGYGDAYRTADCWKNFTIVEDAIDPTLRTITLGTNNYATYCSDANLDFSEVEGLKAYIASSFSPTTGALIITRVDNVPAGVGVLVKGTPGERYDVPLTDEANVVANLMAGTTTATTLYPTDGDYTNFVLSKNNEGVMGFYRFSGSASMPANKAWLKIPTYALGVTPAKVKSFRFVEEGDEMTGVSIVEEKAEDSNSTYDLQGRKLYSQPARGIYIRNGKKFIK